MQPRHAYLGPSPMRLRGVCRRLLIMTVASLTLGVTSYNVMSMRREGRMEQILRTIGSEAILLQGTREKALEGEHVSYTKRFGYHNYSFGYYGNGVSSHTGVQISLSARVYNVNQLVQVSTPPPKLIAGRVGAVRAKTGTSDVLYVVAYLPPDVGTEKSLRVYKAVLAWICKVIGSFGGRCLPVIAVDANDRLGYVRTPHGPSPLQSSAVGPYEPELQRDRSTLLIEFLERLKLVALNTWFADAAGTTFYSGTSDATSRIDYLLVPLSYYEAGMVRWCRVLLQRGDKLQLVPACRRVDHRPVNAGLTLNLVYAGDEKARVQWDHDKIMWSFISGSHRQPFIDEVEEFCNENVCDDAASPTKQWQSLIVDGVRGIAAKHFAVKKTAEHRHGDERRKLLQSRARLAGEAVTLFGSCLVRDEVARLLKRGDTLQVVLNAWHGMARLVATQRKVTAFFNEKNAERRERLRIETQLAWRGRRLAEAWKAARLMNHRPRGSKARNYRRVIHNKPSILQIKEKWALPGSQGGCSAVATTLEETLQFFEDEHEGSAIRLPDANHFVKAAEDLKRTAFYLARSAHRKTTPEWDFPAEIHSILLSAKRVLTLDNVSGVGYRNDIQVPHTYVGKVKRILASVRATGTTVFQFSHSRGFQVPKKEGSRTVHGLSPFGKSYFKQLIRHERNAEVEVPHHVCSVRGRRREEAIAAKCIVTQRAHDAGYSVYGKNYDVVNAFASPDFSELDTAVDAYVNGEDDYRDQDRGFIKQHHRYNLCTLEASDGEVHLHATCGTCQGNTVATELSGKSYWGTLDEWTSQTTQDLLQIESPITGNKIDGSITTFVDDVSRSIVFRSWKELLEFSKKNDDTLDECMAPKGLAQHRGKAEGTTWLVGQGAHECQRLLPSGGVDIGAKILRDARYLGPHIHYQLCDFVEINRRLKAARNAWFMFTGFWASKVDLRFRALVFRCIVYSVLLTGLTSFALSRASMGKLTSYCLDCGRRLLQGAATDKYYDYDGNLKYRRKPNIYIWRSLGMADCFVELHIQRLKFFQKVCIDPQHHELYLSALYGRMVWDPPGVGITNKWIIQLKEDIRALEVDDNIASFLSNVNYEPKILFLDRDLAIEFAAFDVSILRAAFLHVAIPPDGVEGGLLLSGSVPGQGDFMCGVVCGDGTVCDRTFQSRQALRQHLTYQRGNGHGRITVESLVCTAQCPWCASFFSSVASARQHVRHAFTNQHCDTDRSVVPQIHSNDFEVCCNLCDESFESPQLYNWHVRQHVAPPGSITLHDKPSSQKLELISPQLRHGGPRCDRGRRETTQASSGNIGSDGDDQSRSVAAAYGSGVASLALERTCKPSVEIGRVDDVEGPIKFSLLCQREGGHREVRAGRHPNVTHPSSAPRS